MDLKDIKDLSDNVSKEHLPLLGLIDQKINSDMEKVLSAVSLLQSSIEHTIGSVVTKIDAVETKLETKIDGVETKLETKIDGVARSLKSEIGGIKTIVITIIVAIVVILVAAILPDGIKNIKSLFGR